MKNLLEILIFNCSKVIKDLRVSSLVDQIISMVIDYGVNSFPLWESLHSNISYIPMSM